jgi:hypothetical protein
MPLILSWKACQIKFMYVFKLLNIKKYIKKFDKNETWAKKP